MHKYKWIVIAAVFSFAVSCVGYYETVIRSSDVDVKYKGAFHFFNEGKYRKAAEIFEGLTLTMQGLPQEDTVKYYNALSNYNYGDYVTAESNFSSFLDVFPRSPFAEDAAFLRIKCLYEGTYRYELDQTPTHRAMTVINEFLYENPDSKYAKECRDMLDEFQEARLEVEKKDFDGSGIHETEAGIALRAWTDGDWLVVDGLPSGIETRLQVVSTDGRVLLDAESRGEETLRMDVHHLSPGFYLLHAGDGVRQSVFRFIRR